MHRISLARPNGDDFARDHLPEVTWLAAVCDIFI
jgi:hypothetical protein